MKIQLLALIIGNALLVSAGSILMRYGGRNLDWSLGITGVLTTGKLWLAGLFMGWIAGITYATLLTRNELITIHFPYIVFNFIFVALGGFLLLGEHFSITKLIGIILAFCGVYLLIRG